ncbi:hypothetical protein MMC21_002007, partial [Puttea exsequens]|nr:hypothetical protein [Puttea exsequens]
HVVPDWYHALVPLSGMNPTPNWTVKAHLEFMAANDIGHDVVSISTPGSGVYLGDSKSSVGLARLLNEVNVLEDAVLVATDMCLIFANAK